MAENLHSMETYKREDGKVGWRINMGDNVVAGDQNQGFENRKDALQSMFGIFFGLWDESFLGLYSEWQAYPDTGYEVGPLAQEGAPVHIHDPNAPGIPVGPPTPSHPPIGDEDGLTKTEQIANEQADIARAELGLPPQHES